MVLESDEIQGLIQGLPPGLARPFNGHHLLPVVCMPGNI